MKRPPVTGVFYIKHYLFNLWTFPRQAYWRAGLRTLLWAFRRTYFFSSCFLFVLFGFCVAICVSYSATQQHSGSSQYKNLFHIVILNELKIVKIKRDMRLTHIGWLPCRGEILILVAGYKYWIGASVRLWLKGRRLWRWNCCTIKERAIKAICCPGTAGLLWFWTLLFLLLLCLHRTTHFQRTNFSWGFIHTYR